MGATYTTLLYHVVFSTKHRLPLISPDLKPRLYAYMGGILREDSAVLFDANGVEDHVHLLLGLKPIHALATVMKVLKSKSSKWVNDLPARRERFEWQTGYAAFTVSESRTPMLRAYLAKQVAHHETVSFKEELIRLLEAHKIPYDPRYVFE